MVLAASLQFSRRASCRLSSRRYVLRFDFFPGENIDHYHAAQTAIFRDIASQSAIEWLLAIDIAELSWERQIACYGIDSGTPTAKRLAR